MKERPILFSSPMVRALLDGSKTQTRRLVKDTGLYAIDESIHGQDVAKRELLNLAKRCPYGSPGDRLWVRETHAIVPRTAYAHSDGVQQTLRLDDPYEHDAAIYREGWTRSKSGFSWRPSIHMPRWASRITLEITSVRVERLQDISEADAEAEGCERLGFEREVPDWKICPKCGGTRLHDAIGSSGGVVFDVDCTACDTYVKRYKHLWESINGAGSWNLNPWVWVVEFKVVPK